MNDTIVSSTQAAPRWLLLLAQLPAKPDYLRVKLQRRVRRVGALPLRGAVYVLPNRDDTTEDFTWIRLELLADGGEAILCAASALAGVTDAELETMFRDARDADYREIADAAHAVAAESPADDAARARLRRRLEEVTKVDFFAAPARAEAERALDALATPAPTARVAVGPGLANRVWVTRAGVFVDRIASAWLVRRFIDPGATFKFVPASGYAPRPGELRFDMYDGEYTHEGDRCTFETLRDRFGLDAPGLAAVGEIVHDIDCKDAKFGRAEAPGVEALLAGIARANPDDAARLAHGAALFDALLAQLGGA